VFGQINFKNVGSMLMKIVIPFLTFFFSAFISFGQTGTLRGHIYDAESGDPIPFASVQLLNSDAGVISDIDGFFQLSEVPSGKQKIQVSYLGYLDTLVEVDILSSKIKYQLVFLNRSTIELQTVDISASKERARTEIQIGQIQLSRENIKSLPSVGGESDIAQYLTALPGVVLSGDQGGQIFIRGGSPVQNRVLLDGQLIYNPFHSIGLFSVFETEIIRSVDVLSAGFNAEHGGRISAVLDIKTREGNKNRISGLASISPFQGKILVEGPIKPLKKENGTAISFLVTGKYGWLDKTSPHLYRYAVDSNFYSFAKNDTALSSFKELGLPYQYQDLYGKISFMGENGSKVNLFGFSFTDQFKLPNIASQKWETFGGGMYFLLSPLQSPVRIEGNIGYSRYNLSLIEKNIGPRTSSLESYTARLDFMQVTKRTALEYGLELISLNTGFQFENPFNLTISQNDFTTEMAAFLRFKYQFKKFIVQPGFRLHYYASQGQFSPEPRVGLKYLWSDNFRLKMGGGLYSQNLISLANNQDVVQLFSGFLVGPETTLYRGDSKVPVKSRLQKANHIVAGFEWEPFKLFSVSVEGYQKTFNQLISLNRNKRKATDPDFLVEEGSAMGLDFAFAYKPTSFDIGLSYSLASVYETSNMVRFPTIFDRRHSLNFLFSYLSGKTKQWKWGAHWYVGSGFPFTQTQGFFEDNKLTDLLQTDIVRGNYPLGTLLADEINGGRLSYYHRLDLSIQYMHKLNKFTYIESTFAVTNVYNRQNVFYLERISNQRVNQLPVIPSLNMTVGF
jgi:hypothetical protein